MMMIMMMFRYKSVKLEFEVCGEIVSCKLCCRRFYFVHIYLITIKNGDRKQENKKIINTLTSFD